MLRLIGLGSFLCFAANFALAASPTIKITSPANNSTQNSTIHYVASASSPQCAKGISQMRIYSQEHVVAYTANSNHLDTNIHLSPGSYKTTVHAWDHCGNSSTETVNITVTNANLRPAKFVFVTNASDDQVIGFRVNSSTGALTPTGQVPVATGDDPVFAAPDKNGYRLYVANRKSQNISAYFIYRNDGFLHAVPGSPFSVAGTPNYVTVSPSGKFVYVGISRPHGGGAIAVFSMHSDGSLSSIAGSPYSTAYAVLALAVDPTGTYLYASRVDENINEYTIDQSTGELTPLPGEPHTIRLPDQGDCSYLCSGYVLDLATDPGGNFLIAPLEESGSVATLTISKSTGTLTNARKSPFILLLPGSPTFPGATPYSVTIDANGRFVYTDGCYDCTNDTYFKYIQQLQLSSSSGTLARANHFFDPTVCDEGTLRADPSGKYLYVLAKTECDAESGTATQSSPPAILAFSGSNMTMAPGSPFLLKLGAQFTSIAVTP
jgi:6-phosphogluconolactonase (cycloisomerase 2 family)